MKLPSLRPHIYPAKCLLGFCIGYLLYKHFPQHQFYWTLISILLVIAPDGVDSNKLALERMAANILGSSVGLLIYLIHEPNLLLFCVGIVAAIYIGTMLKLTNVLRSALVSLVIVMIHDQQKSTLVMALERIGCVFIGCAIAVLITFLFNSVFRIENSTAAEAAE